MRREPHHEGVPTSSSTETTDWSARAYAVWLLLLAVKLAIVLMLVPNLPILTKSNYAVNLLPDSYANIAWNLHQGNGYRVFADTAETMIRPPVNVFLLLALFSVFGQSLAAVQVVNVLLTVAGGLLLMKMVRRQTRDPLAAWVAAVTFVLHPGIMLAETRGGVEIPITFLVVLFIYVLDLSFRSNRARTFFLAGLVLGITALTKSTPVIIAPFLFVYGLLRFRGQRLLACRNVVVLWLGLGVMLTPWVVRNYLVSGHFVPSMTIKGAAAHQGLYISTHDMSDVRFSRALDAASRAQKDMAREAELPFSKGHMLPIFYSPRHEVEFDSYLYQLVIREYKERPVLLVKTIAQNSWRFWFQGRTHSSTVLNTIITLPLLAFAVVGVYLSIRRRLGLDLMILFATVYYLAHLPFIAFAKYHVPLIPFLTTFAAVALSGPLKSLLARRSPSTRMPGPLWEAAPPEARHTEP